MNKPLVLFLVITFLSCNQVQYGEKNEIGYNYYFDSISGDDSNIGTKEKPFKSFYFLENIKLKQGDKILLIKMELMFPIIWLIITKKYLLSIQKEK